MSKLFEFSIFFLIEKIIFFSRINSKSKSGYHPFPEMTRFLNLYSRIHYQSLKKASAPRSTFPLLEYICR